MSWKTAEPPWTLGGKYNKRSYNEGNKITTDSNPVFVPATDTAPGQTPVTTKHIPCGYWWDKLSKWLRGINVLGVAVDFCSSGSIVIGPGCEDGTCVIAYTSQQMTVDEEQTLSVTSPADLCTYYWVITVGGGSLSAASGDSVVYTAPATNANCVSNATIILTTRGEVCDTLEIAVDSASGELDAGWWIYNVSCTGGHCRANGRKVGCDGSIGSTIFSYDSPTDEDGNCYDCAAVGNCPSDYTGYWDARSDAYKLAGCCPSLAIGVTRDIDDFTYTNSCP